jgi:ribonuclease P protein component
VQRLKTRAQFQAVMAGAIVARTPHFALHRLAAGPAGPSDGAAAPVCLPGGACIGAVVPKRWAKRAVTRNTIKRQIFAVSAAHEARLLEAAHVVRLRSAFDRAEFVSATSDRLRVAVRTELEQLLARVRPLPATAAAAA